MPKPTPIPYEPRSNPSTAEEESVHSVYEAIAPHFAQTRHKPWPLISTFLHSLPPNSLGLDSGAGNGKYLPTAKEAGVEMIALDSSKGLLDIARGQSRKGKEKEVGGGGEGEGAGGWECVRGDLGFRGWRSGLFDFVISIAAIHHLSTPDRRKEAVRTILSSLYHTSKPPYSRFIIYVWAYEQSVTSKRRMGASTTLTSSSTSQRAESIGSSVSEGEGEGEEKKVQDVLVPWVLQSRNPPKPQKGRPAASSEVIERTKVEGRGGEESNKAEGEREESKVFHRYYHLFIAGELRELLKEAGREEGYMLIDKDTEEDGEMPERGNRRADKTAEGNNGDGRKWLRIRGEGWEIDNWWIEGEVALLETEA